MFAAELTAGHVYRLRQMASKKFAAALPRKSRFIQAQQDFYLTTRYQVPIPNPGYPKDSTVVGIRAEGDFPIAFGSQWLFESIDANHFYLKSLINGKYLTAVLDGPCGGSNGLGQNATRVVIRGLDPANPDYSKWSFERADKELQNSYR